MVILMIQWKIKPDPESHKAFLHHWRVNLPISDYSQLVGEFLSEPLTEEQVGFKCDVFEPGNYTPFFNIAVWEDAAAFKRVVYDPYANKKRELLPFEVDHPKRMVVSPLNWRIGQEGLPDRDAVRASDEP